MIYQNYASNPLEAPDPELRIPRMGGATLQLPPIKAVPGSFLASNLAVGPATVMVTVDTTVTDRANLPGGNANSLTRPFMRHVHVGGRPGARAQPGAAGRDLRRLAPGRPAAVRQAGHHRRRHGPHDREQHRHAVHERPGHLRACPVTGRPDAPAADRAASRTPRSSGRPGDIEVGPFLNPASTITDSPRGTIVPGVMDDQNGIAPSGILHCIEPDAPAAAPAVREPPLRDGH